MGIFNRRIFNNAIFNTTNNVQVGGGGGGPVDYRAYRKQLRKIARAADKRLYAEARRNLQNLAVNAPITISSSINAIQKQIDFEALIEHQSQNAAVELSIALKKLDELISTAIMREIEAEEEMILIMVIV